MSPMAGRRAARPATRSIRRYAVTRALDGVRVVELAHFAYVPSAGAVLADWGADVIKIEHPRHGDPMRGTTIGGIPPGTGGFTFMWEMANRGKRSVGVDLSTPAGRELLLSFVASADVFLTSFLPGVRERLAVSEADLRAVNPGLVYATGWGQGPEGPESAAGGYDQTSFWYRAGVASALTGDQPVPPDLPGPGFGDITSGLALAGGVAAALVQRARTGEGVLVDGSLLATGMWMMQPAIAAAEVAELDEFRFLDRYETQNPLVNAYRTADGRFIGLCVMKTDKHWAELCEAFGTPELVHDPRFHDQEARTQNAAELVRLLEDVFARHTLTHWTEALGRQTAQWAVVQRGADLKDDPQVVANRYLREVDYGGGRSISLVPAPVQLDRTAPELRPAPELGADTEVVLMEHGVDWDRIEELKASGIVT
jgi:crotonobetainyl-CoA:carnitine CoA-transferase CaiB-like acyl-CoA transferase